MKASFVYLFLLGEVTNCLLLCSPLAPDTRRPRGVNFVNSGARTCQMAIFGSGGPRLGNVPKTKAAIQENKVFRDRLSQFWRGAITATDLVRTLDQGVASQLPGVDLEDVVAVAMGLTTNPRQRNLLLQAGKGRQTAPGAGVAAGQALLGGQKVVEGQRGVVYMMEQGGQRVSSGKSFILNGAQMGKKLSPRGFKVTTRANADIALRGVRNFSHVRKSNWTNTTSRLFVGFEEFVENYNGRGDSVLIMEAGSTDLKKLADGSTGGITKGKLKAYTVAMVEIIRCIHKAGLVWSDLKLDNLVLSMDGQVKAIDLDSAVKMYSPLVDYSPEATPPEVAHTLRFEVDPPLSDRSLDVWSLGMAVLHMHLGRAYFEGRSNAQIMSSLVEPGFAVDLSGVQDVQARSMLKGLLDPDPRKRLAMFDSPLFRVSLMF
ncbi:unnamed protein product [Discosporangium mesarthrocarpum]